MCPDLIAYAVLEIRGEVPEWSNGAVSKTVVPQGTVGSNPTLSAISLNNPTGYCSFPAVGSGFEILSFET